MSDSVPCSLLAFIVLLPVLCEVVGLCAVQKTLIRCISRRHGLHEPPQQQPHRAE